METLCDRGFTRTITRSHNRTIQGCVKRSEIAAMANRPYLQPPAKLKLKRRAPCHV
jgi:hypothetical protein